MNSSINETTVVLQEGSNGNCRSGAAIFQAVMTAAEAKASMALRSMVPLAILAGMMIGAGACLMLMVKADTTLSFAPSQILGGFCFSLGLVCVIVAGAELFTGNNLMLPAATSGRISWKGLGRNWIVVYLGNFLGSMLLALIVLGSGVGELGSGAVGNAMVNVAYAKINLEPAEIFFRAVMCNWLVCLAVWMAFAGKTVIDKIFTTIFPIMAFVACGFEHCVANMFLLPMGIFSLHTYGFGGNPDLADAVWATLTASGAAYNIAIATLGNIVGGAILVAMMYFFAYRK